MRCPSSVRSRRYSVESASAAALTAWVARLPPAVLRVGFLAGWPDVERFPGFFEGESDMSYGGSCLRAVQQGAVGAVYEIAGWNGKLSERNTPLSLQPPVHFLATT